MSFGSLWNGYDVVLEAQLESISFLHDMNSLLRARASLASSYAADLSKLVAKAHNKKSVRAFRTRLDAGPDSGAAALDSLFSEWDNTAAACSLLGEQIESGPIAALGELESLLEVNAKKMASEGKILNKEKKDVLSALGRSRMAFLKASKEAEIAEKTHKARLEDPGARPKELDKLAKKAGKAENEAQAKHAAYTDNVDSTNTYLEGFYAGRMPYLLAQAQADFEMRTAAFKASLHDLAVIEARTLDASSDAIARARHSIDAIRPEEELVAFVNAHMPDTDSFKPYEVVEYKRGKQTARKRRLPRLPSALTSSTQDGGGGGGGDDGGEENARPPPEHPQFAVPLASLASEEAPVPEVLVTMMRLMREAGMMDTEGVFRKPGSKPVVDALRDSFDYATPLPDNPDIHTLASLLKEWFRSLPEPAVPAHKYPDAVAAGNAVDSDPQGPLAVLDSFDLLHRECLYALFDLLTDMCHPDIVEITLMSPNNLAVCFAPPLLRSPATNPMEAMANMDAEIAFVRTIIEQLYAQKESASASPSAPPAAAEQGPPPIPQKPDSFQPPIPTKPRTFSGSGPSDPSIASVASTLAAIDLDASSSSGDNGAVGDDGGSSSMSSASGFSQ